MFHDFFIVLKSICFNRYVSPLSLCGEWDRGEGVGNLLFDDSHCPGVICTDNPDQIDSGWVPL
jgi:hypothetical protein